MRTVTTEMDILKVYLRDKTNRNWLVKVNGRREVKKKVSQ
jgi:hypothetical protein